MTCKFIENAALPHGSGTENRTLTNKDFVLLDTGGTFQGYFSDMTRVRVTGIVNIRKLSELTRSLSHVCGFFSRHLRFKVPS